MIYTVD